MHPKKSIFTRFPVNFDDIGRLCYFITQLKRAASLPYYYNRCLEGGLINSLSSIKPLFSCWDSLVESKRFSSMRNWQRVGSFLNSSNLLNFKPCLLYFLFYLCQRKYFPKMFLNISLLVEHSKHGKLIQKTKEKNK